jgi:predicted nucleic acid-binding protein
MAVLIDTSILGRLEDGGDVYHPVARDAVFKLRRKGEELFITSQNLIEFRNFATRPVGKNGLGLTAVAAAQLSNGFEADFPLLVETRDIYPKWRALVDGLGVDRSRCETRGRVPRSRRQQPVDL